MLLTIPNNILNNPRTLLIICLVLALMTSMAIFYTAWQWRADWQVAHQVVTAKPVLKLTNAHVSLINDLPKAHLFGQAFSKGQVPTSNLQLRVTGIVKADQSPLGAFSKASKAYISIAGQPSKIYHIGDDLPYGVKVYDITTNMVILQNDGRLEKLPLPREPLAFKAKNNKDILS